MAGTTRSGGRSTGGKAPRRASTTTAPGTGRLAQVRLRADEVRALQEVMRALDLESTSDALREGLRLLAREAAEVGAAEEIRAFYREGSAPLPDGVTEPTAEELAAADAMRW
ncbi:hypothetical protein [Streptomyces sp. NPDC097619]|uniref:hypothetical protein n=1 Tax=Streptomyces sp. NPDC097619 TaxID=3157228 RepID=UPI0033281D49